MIQENKDLAVEFAVCNLIKKVATMLNVCCSISYWYFYILTYRVVSRSLIVPEYQSLISIYSSSQPVWAFELPLN